MVSLGIKHTMIVAVDSEVKNVIVGFLEIGLLPNPAGINPTVEIIDPNFITGIYVYLYIYFYRYGDMYVFT
jgi:hypothetical protein